MTESIDIRINEKLTSSSKTVLANSFSIEGIVDVRIPGNKNIISAEGVNVKHSDPMSIKLNGLLREDYGLIPLSDYVKEADVLVYADRVNQTELAMGKKQVIKDPEIIIRSNGREITLNQVHGVPRLYVREGIIRYK